MRHLPLILHLWRYANSRVTETRASDGRDYRLECIRRRSSRDTTVVIGHSRPTYIAHPQETAERTSRAGGVAMDVTSLQIAVGNDPRFGSEECDKDATLAKQSGIAKVIAESVGVTELAVGSCRGGEGPRASGRWEHYLPQISQRIRPAKASENAIAEASSGRR